MLTVIVCVVLLFLAVAASGLSTPRVLQSSFRVRDGRRLADENSDESKNNLFVESEQAAITERYHAYHRCPSQTGPLPATPPRPKWAIITLSRPSDPYILQRNAAIVSKLRPYASQHNITSIFFSEEVIPESVEKQWRSGFESIGVAVKIINTAKYAYYPLKEDGSSNEAVFGYRYMCKFFALDVYKYLKPYDFYFRIDSDCFLQHLNFDILKWAEDSRVEYAYLLRKIDAHHITQLTLPLFIARYLGRCSINPTCPMDVPLSTCLNFYNNVHIGRVAFFLRPDVQHFLHATNSTGRILDYRWGDSSIQAYAIRLFMSPKGLRQIPHLTYVHGSHANVTITPLGAKKRGVYIRDQ